MNHVTKRVERSLIAGLCDLLSDSFLKFKRQHIVGNPRQGVWIDGLKTGENRAVGQILVSLVEGVVNVLADERVAAVESVGNPEVNKRINADELKQWVFFLVFAPARYAEIKRLLQSQGTVQQFETVVNQPGDVVCVQPFIERRAKRSSVQPRLPRRSEKNLNRPRHNSLKGFWKRRPERTARLGKLFENLFLTENRFHLLPVDPLLFPRLFQLRFVFGKRRVGNPFPRRRVE